MMNIRETISVLNRERTISSYTIITTGISMRTSTSVTRRAPRIPRNRVIVVTTPI